MTATRRWGGTWPDALAFAGGLAMAWFAGWQTTDLVWSLWLSSLVIGYATIVWSIFRPGLVIVRGAWRDRAMLDGMPLGSAAGGAALMLGGGLFLLAFFTVHFGMFHFVHSQFLALFFPLDPDGTGSSHMAGMQTYLEVARRYWVFLPAAFLAERVAFRLEASESPAPPDTAVTPEAIARRKAAKAPGFTGMMEPYKNVVRLHLLIFFFVAAHFAKLDAFPVFAVVYAVYFFPWRLLRKPDGTPAQPAAGAA